LIRVKPVAVGPLLLPSADGLGGIGEMLEWTGWGLLGLVLLASWLAALPSAARAIMHTRTAQGAAAWVLALLLMAPLTLPFYWVLGRTKFSGYVTRRRKVMARAGDVLKLDDGMDRHRHTPAPPLDDIDVLARRLGVHGFLGGNAVELLVDGEDTYAAILAAIAAARDFVLVQFYIVRDDGIGGRLREALAARAGAGVKVHFLYDEVGSTLGRGFLDALREAGVHCHPFDPGRKGSRLQINFRNHRKVVVVDGTVAFVGGHNVGDDYLGLHPDVGPWRDTHLRIKGPAAAQAQIAFFRDWFWACDAAPDVPFHVRPAEGGEAEVLVWPTGPADPQPECLMMHLAAIGAARKRLWLATPYFVPPEAVLQALRLALLRGVDVRILVPGWNDNRVVGWASQVHLADLAGCGAHVHRWPRGFMHQKVLLVDDCLTLVGTANLDNRSMFINFEVTALCVHAPLVTAVASMLEKDFEHAPRVPQEEFRNAGYWHRLRCRAANLVSPML